MSDMPEFALRHESTPPRIDIPQPPLVVLLHGYGSNEEDLLQLAPYFPDQCRIVSFRAPFLLMPGANCWYELDFGSHGIRADIGQAQQSLTVLSESISAAIAAYATDPERTFVVGFSQGGGMAGLVATQLPHLRGAAILSGINPFTLSTNELPTPQCDVLVVHGSFDEVVPVAVGHGTRDQLRERGVAVTYAEYPIGHTVDLRVIASLTRFLGERL